MSEEEYAAEVVRLHEFTLRLANRLFLAAECLARNAEKRNAKTGESVKLIKDMTEPELRAYFDRLAKLIEDWLPPGPSAKGKCLFFLTVADQIEPGIAQYVSNVQREDAIKMLRETADRLERNQDVTR